ncbi:MAG: MoaD/ThiS family protein [SAR324 cluster bacterium]|nr:MoaD/ThiS family protein [SAR324 cluster bacterium]
MNIKVHLLGALVDYLPDSDRGQAVLSLEEGVSIAGMLGQLGITRRVEVAVNDEHDQDHARVLQDGDAVMVFSNFGGG